MSVKSFVISNLAFSLASPLGLVIGIFVADQPSSLPQVTNTTGSSMLTSQDDVFWLGVQILPSAYPYS